MANAFNLGVQNAQDMRAHLSDTLQSTHALIAARERNNAELWGHFYDMQRQKMSDDAQMSRLKEGNKARIQEQQMQNDATLSNAMFNKSADMKKTILEKQYDAVREFQRLNWEREKFAKEEDNKFALEGIKQAHDDRRTEFTVSHADERNRQNNLTQVGIHQAEETGRTNRFNAQEKNKANQFKIHETGLMTRAKIEHDDRAIHEHNYDQHNQMMEQLRGNELGLQDDKNKEERIRDSAKMLAMSGQNFVALQNANTARDKEMNKLLKDDGALAGKYEIQRDDPQYQQKLMQARQSEISTRQAEKALTQLFIDGDHGDRKSYAAAMKRITQGVPQRNLPELMSYAQNQMLQHHSIAQMHEMAARVTPHVLSNTGRPEDDPSNRIPVTQQEFEGLLHQDDKPAEGEKGFLEKIVYEPMRRYQNRQALMDSGNLYDSVHLQIMQDPAIRAIPRGPERDAAIKAIHSKIHAADQAGNILTPALGLTPGVRVPYKNLASLAYLANKGDKDIRDVLSNDFEGLGNEVKDALIAEAGGRMLGPVARLANRIPFVSRASQAMAETAAKNLPTFFGEYLPMQAAREAEYVNGVRGGLYQQPGFSPWKQGPEVVEGAQFKPGQSYPEVPSYANYPQPESFVGQPRPVPQFRPSIPAGVTQRPPGIASPVYDAPPSLPEPIRPTPATPPTIPEFNVTGPLKRSTYMPGVKRGPIMTPRFQGGGDVSGGMEAGGMEEPPTKVIARQTIQRVSSEPHPQVTPEDVDSIRQHPEEILNLPEVQAQMQMGSTQEQLDSTIALQFNRIINMATKGLKRGKA